MPNKLHSDDDGIRPSRRALLSLAAAGALTPLFGARVRGAPLPRDADVAVIGAGAAGIAAARRVMAAGRRVIMLEASSQIGGRCLTDATTFDTPFDRGARWLHDPDSNPLAPLARGSGIDLYAAPPGQKIRIGRRNARAGETEEFLATLVRANRAIDAAGRGRADMACAAALPKDLGAWAGAIEFLLGPYATGKDLKDVSAMDRFRAQDRVSAVAARQGLGALIARLGESLPVALSTPAQRVIWSGRDVAVETPAGRVAARAVIVTVSTNVLLSGAIRFAPELPKSIGDAAARLGLGNIDRVTLQLSGNALGLGHDEVVIEQSGSPRTAALYANIGGSALCSVDVAGGFGRDLAAQGEPAMTAFAVEWLAKLFGSDAAAAVTKSSATRWTAQPFVLGALSAASPGGQAARRVLSQPQGGLFFAGEATHETLFATVEGAWDSGERAADAALRALDAAKSASTPRSSGPSRSRRSDAPKAPRAGRNRDR